MKSHDDLENMLVAPGPSSFIDAPAAANDRDLTTKGKTFSDKDRARQVMKRGLVPFNVDVLAESRYFSWPFSAVGLSDPPNRVPAIGPQMIGARHHIRVSPRWPAIILAALVAWSACPLAYAQVLSRLPPTAPDATSPLGSREPILTASSILTLEGNAPPGGSLSAGTAILQPDPSADPPPFWLSRQVTAAWLPVLDDNGFGTTDVDANTTIVVWYVDDEPALLVTPGFGFHSWIGQEQLDLPPRVFDAYVDVNARWQFNETWGLNLGVTPGAYGDFESFSSKTFQMTGWGLLVWTWSPKFSLLGGVAVVRQLESHILPIGGALWTPDDDTRIELFIPRPRLARRLIAGECREVWLYLAGEFGGGAWSITLPGDDDELVIYNDLRVIAGIEWLEIDRLTGVVEAAYVFDREILAFGLSQARPSDTFMLRASLAF
jgi:hypothetical protein